MKINTKIIIAASACLVATLLIYQNSNTDQDVSEVQAATQTDPGMRTVPVNDRQGSGKRFESAGQGEDDLAKPGDMSRNTITPKSPPVPETPGIDGALASTAPRGQEVAETDKPEPAADTSSDEPEELSIPPAIRLSENFKLPAIVVANYEGAMKERSPRVQAAAKYLEDEFYRELAKEVAKSGDWKEKAVVDPETGETTVTVEPGPEVEKVSRRFNERFRMLFGQAKFNAYSLRAGNERMAIATGSRSVGSE